MPLTPAERQRKYREKLKRENPIKYDEMKKKTAECALRYYKKKVSQYTEEEKIERRKKWQEERKRQKQADQAKVDISKPAKTQKDIEYKLRRKNKELQKENKILRNRFNALRKKFYRQSKKLDELNLAFLEFKKTETNQENQEELIENLKPLPNTLKIHQVIFKDKNAVNFRNLSCFCKNMSGKCDCYSTKTHRFEINKEAQPRNTVKRKLNTIKRSKVGTKKRRESTASTTESDCTEIEYLDDSDATHFSETYQEEYLELDENNQEEYLESGENILRERQEKRAEKGSGKTDFENEGLEVRRLVENIDEKIKEVQIEKKTASQKGVTILSDIRNSPWNKRYFDLKRCGGLQFKKVDSNFDLCSLKKSLDVPISTENIDPYKNPVASSSGIKTKTENQKTKDFEENRKTYFSSLNKGDQTKNIEEDFEGKARYDIKDSIKTNEIKEEGRQNSGVISIVEANKNENTKVYDESDVKIKINQYVLVRYYIRKTWKYYIGRVVEIHTKDEDTNYTINFLKTIKKPSLRFTTPKKMDTDTVPSLSIVKTIELNEEDNKKNEYLLKDDFNETYFEL
ncbi:glutamic acid-rich protein-like [Maniola jurtina]|uniref:glutamic acid-rich protein-like n=1 Tax=Maniola jurtina TaxID=191418 RepID=UPI001E68858A|nr:glutamic acid-rich protein-like [Maniola jurtina]